MRSNMPPPIAIVGVSVELPSGGHSAENFDHKSFFEFLLSSGEAYEEMPSGRFNVEAWKGTGIGKVHVNRGAFLKDIDTFDNVEFGISSRDAQAMAPATRKLLENSFLALLDSGIDYRMKKVGCFTSGTSIDLMNVSEPDEFDSRGSFAGYPSMIANRISNHLDLLGPSLPVDTACSSTLTAMHLAVQAIANGDCEAAVVGGCQLNHRFADWITYSQGSLLAKDGKCKPFDGAADGFARAEACAVVVVKPLEDAVRDRDHIYATILGTAINSTGSAAPPGAPVAESQRDAMIQAFERAGKNPREVDYVELHATGTAKGDPTEANWVGEHFHREDELLVGSVKANIGHTEIVAFLASLSKVISIFERKTVPPQVNISHLNPGIKWEEYRLRVPMEPTPLSVRSKNKSLVSIAGSGIGGSNGHVVLESPPLFEPYSTISNVQRSDNSPVLIMVGGLSSRAVTASSESIQKDFSLYLSDLPGLSTVLGRRAKQTTWRAYTIAGSDKAELPDSGTPEHCPRNVNSLVYVFSGQGPQHKDMGRELFEKFPVFRQSILEMDDVFRKSTGQSIIHDYGLFDRSSAPSLPEIWPIALVLPSIAIFQIALFDLLVSLGMKPDAVVGHSAGETAVLYASGAAPKAMAVELAIIRGKSFAPIEQLGGTMAAVGCTAQVMEEILLEYRKEHPQCLVEVACFNSPSAVAIAGEEIAVDAVVSLADARGIFARKLRTKVPFHSSMMEESKDVYCSALEDLFERYPGSHSPKTATFSTLTATLFEGNFDADYFWSNTRSPVRFTETMEAMRAMSPNATFVELAPHPVLASYIVNMASETSTVLHSVQRPKRGSPSTEQLDLLRLCGKVTVAGHNCVDFTALNGRECSEFTLPLPSYPFLRKKYPLYPDTPGVMKQMESPRGPLNHGYLRINKETHPTLAEHVIRGEPIMPAAGYLEMALEFGASTLMNVNLRSILSLSSEKPVKVDIHLDGAFWTIKSFASTPKSRKDVGPGTSGRLHADGYLSFEIPSAVLPLDIKAVRNRCTGHIGSDFYPSLSYFSTYGTRFQRVTNVYYNANEALASIKGMDSTLASDGKYFLHPAILDACIQVSAYKPFHGDYDPNVYYLPAHVDAVIVHQQLKTAYFPAHLYAHVEMKKWKPTSMQYDICLVDDSGVRLCTFVGLEVAKHYINPVSDASRPLQVVMQPVFHSPRVQAKEQCDHADRSDLFATLDKVAIRTKMRMKAGQVTKSATSPLGLNERWAAYFEHLDSDKAILPSEGPHFDQAIMCSLNSLRNALKSFDNSDTTVVQILVASVVKTDVFRIGIEEVLREFPLLHVSLFVDNKHSSQSLPTVASGMVRNARVNVSGPSGIEDQLFDIVFFFNVVDGQTDPQRTIETAHSLLVPGGTFILTERNLEAWDMGSLGTMWYDSTFGAPTNGEIYPLTSYLESMAKFKVLRVHNSEDADPFHFCVESQKSAWTVKETPESPLFDSSESFVYAYTFGNELDLQWELSGLNTAQTLDLWITATQGRDGSAAQGLARALRRECISWTIRLVVFPPEYDDDMRQEFLDHLPLELRYEQDIIVSADDSSKLLVPRIVPVPQIEAGIVETNQSADDRSVLPPHHVLLRPLSFSKQGAVSGILASIVDGPSSGFQEGEIVVGLVDVPIEELMVVDAATLTRVPSELAKEASTIPALIPGFVTAILAPGLSTFSRPCRMKLSRVLLTHADTVTGSNVSSLTTKNGLRIERICQQTSLYDLAKLYGEPYDIIISGYTDQAYIQILQTLLAPRHGRLFLWNDDTHGLPGILRRDPCSIADALRHSFSMIDADVEPFKVPANATATTLGREVFIKRPAEISDATTFNSNKTYIIVGGIGTIGAHLALFMYERGARHIILTSRSGRKSLNVNTNVVVRRMFEYLEQKDDLHLSLLAVDATDASAMKAMLGGVGQFKVGGCILLAAVLLDGIFRHLQESDFSTVFSAKLGAYEILKQVFDVRSLDFIVSFTSVSGLFGFGGQTNYGAANTALEEEMSRLSNGFSFVCPGILDSTLMLAGTGEANESRLSALIPWSVSAQDMIQWFDDSMSRFQRGQRVVRYLPDLNWEALDRTQGMPRLGRHLLPNETVEAASDMDDASQMSKIVRNVLDIPEADFSFDVPLTAYGIDSLSASRISFLLRPFVEVTQIQLLADLSLSDLLRSSQSDVSAPAETQKRPKAATAKVKAELMVEMLAKYSREMNPSTPAVALETSLPLTSHHDDVVLITGTTGTLGSNILAQLLQNNDITLVYALNRFGKSNNSIIQRQRSIFSRQGLPLSLLDSPKLVLLEGDLVAEDLSLPKDVSNKLLSSVSRIIHNAWAVDFATSLDDHEDLIKGTRNLLDFARQSTLAMKPTVSFISTIGVFQHPKDISVIEAPESPVLDPQVSVQTGYIESKWVAERLFQLASENHGLRTNVIRVGLLSGGPNGCWDPSQWFPAIAQSATYLGCLPEGDNLISWLPVDLAAAAIVDMRGTENETLHLVHPKPVQWNDIMQVLATTLNVPLVPYVEWIARLESSAHDADETGPGAENRRAALKLTHFYRIGLNASSHNTESMGLLPKVATDKGVKASPTLQDETVQPLNEHDVEKWVAYWREIGFLPS
ncbi:hypothetical protein GALMADRAFT_158296 [Galerina marginata CBS 339.88]|uniref:Carrier domain-containing protein n=1 Tax=Galerina marginata (strain CBS 339.88) TaxID=685588 RepID=A0A067SZP9_GALM3|nr:hypothetical protein GALMADRAFT_158296 [Galerina marginata CBS 339.88]